MGRGSITIDLPEAPVEWILDKVHAIASHNLGIKACPFHYGRTLPLLRRNIFLTKGKIFSYRGYGLLFEFVPKKIGWW